MGYSLDLLKQIAHGLAQQFSDSCEIVIHDVRHGIENTILYIENGHVTDRKSGDSASNVVLEAIKADPSTLQDQYAYLTKTNDGRLLKSSTFYIKDESGTLAYIFLSIMILPHWLQRISFCSPLSRHRIPPSHPLPAVQPLRLRTMSPSFWIP